MRAMFTVTASVLICVALFGCNRSQQAQAPVPAPIVRCRPVCNCPQQTAAAAPVATDASTDIIIMHGASTKVHPIRNPTARRKTAPIRRLRIAQREYDGAAGEQSAGEAHAEAALWVDGYGRSHYASAAASDDTNPAALAADDVRRRHAPWHAYNSDCDKDR